MESREGLARVLMRSPSLLHPAGSCRLLAMLPTLVPAVQDSPPRRHAPILLGLPAAGVGGASCELHQGRQGAWREPQHPVSTWLPSEVLEHWEQSHNQDRDHSGAGSAQVGPSRTAAWGIGFGMGRV